MDVETTTVSITGVPVDALDLLRADAKAEMYGTGDAGVMRYCLMTLARRKRASVASAGTGGTEVSDGV